MGPVFGWYRAQSAADPRGGGGRSSGTSPSSHGSDRDVVFGAERKWRGEGAAAAAEEAEEEGGGGREEGG